MSIDKDMLVFVDEDGNYWVMDTFEGIDGYRAVTDEEKKEIQKILDEEKSL